ncbi:probable 2-oxoadipate dehydrogenase complex component E1 homolog [Anabrus simplex]|uniref:probable 2-oxoadipate dehydrogenase complex component E1 homolog n=1 Tax=Anabrus simplex TaxID=316456 RepID=UPI0035A28934
MQKLLRYSYGTCIRRCSAIKYPLAPPKRDYDTSKKINNSRYKATIHHRTYHSQTGVYGYRPEPKKAYEVPQEVLDSRNSQSNFYRFVTAYRQHAHKKANTNPVSISEISYVPELDYRRYGLKETDRVRFRGILSGLGEEGTVAEAADFLNNAYGNTLSAEFLHLEEEEEKDWFAQRMEELTRTELDDETRRQLAGDMLKSQAFDKFLATKFVTVKRYGGEGAESKMGFYTELFKLCAKDGVQQVVVCMPHRGRLNFLTGLLHFPPAMIFRKLKGLPEFPDGVKATGDVVSHYISSVDLNINKKILHVTVLYNPSHLEAVNPVSMGKTRARQQSLGDGAYSDTGRWSDKVVNLQVHGDAAFAAQGINQEMLGMTKVPHFEVGGSVHLIVNNQVGFTTPGDRGRSSRYCSDLAKMIAAPVIHVNGDFPEMVVKAARLAVEYQRKFRKDVFVDLNCYRQWGHNELDDPTFTNPTLYKLIQSRRTVPDKYAELLIKSGIMTEEETRRIVNDHSSWLNEILKNLDSHVVKKSYFKRQWSGIQQAPAAITLWDTGVDQTTLHYIGAKSVAYDEKFNLHPHLLKTHVNSRLNKLNEGAKLDWATAEALAVGSLLYQGFYVRLSGQDVGRGTFSHRHFMLVDQETNDMYIPLNHLIEGQKAYLEIANSTLSEEAVLAFEYGMSIESPNKLIIWEAQFGDFFNGAQIQIDTFVTSGETKWLSCNSLVMLLPHGYDGAGPEHSSCRMERFLQLCDSKESYPDGDDVNIHIANPTTPAQYFHLLRRQMLRNFRKPLVIVTPKTLLRLPEVTSSFAEMAPETTFIPVIGDQWSKPDEVRKVIFVTGKHYYALHKEREQLQLKDVAIIRVEGLAPFPTYHLHKEMEKYSNARFFIWSQEEPQNMGAWSYVRPRFENLVGRRLRYVGRPPLAAPAVGVGMIHQREAQEVITAPFKVR